MWIENGSVTNYLNVEESGDRFNFNKGSKSQWTAIIDCHIIQSILVSDKYTKPPLPTLI